MMQHFVKSAFRNLPESIGALIPLASLAAFEPLSLSQPSWHGSKELSCRDKRVIAMTGSISRGIDRSQKELCESWKELMRLFVLPRLVEGDVNTAPHA